MKTKNGMSLTWLAMAMMTAGMTMTSCENGSDVLEGVTTTERQTVTFAVEGDFEKPQFEAMTRAAVTADGKAMTDLYILDYMDGVLQQQLHQTAVDADFGEPTLSLDYGEHHVYFVCSRGKLPVLSTEAHTLTWGTVSDTFYKDYAVTINGGAAATHSVTLNRVATRLQVQLSDEVPEGLATVDMTPATWYYALDYLTGLPTSAQNGKTITLTIPASLIGRTDATLSIFGLSAPTEWTTGISITARNADGGTMGQATITGAPFKTNRTTIYSGNLFSSNGGFTLALSDQWEDAYNGAW